MIPTGVVLDVRTVSPHFPGIGRFALGLAVALERLGRPALIHAVPPDPRLPLPPLAGAGCAATPFELRQQWELPRLLRRLGARLYHSPYYLIPYRPGVPTVVNCFDLIPMVEPGAFDRRRRFVYVLAHRLAFRTAAAVCVPSEATRRDVARLFPGSARKLSVVRPGVAGRRGPAAGADPRGLPAAGGPVTGTAGCPRAVLPPRYVLQVGANKPHKGLDVLLDAWARALRQAPDATAGTTLVLAGPRDRRYAEPGRSVERFGLAQRVADLGEVSDGQLDALYGAATLFVCPSRREGFGLPLAEAMAWGRPCACSDTPALAETAGGAAALFPTGDAPALAATLVSLLSNHDERQRLAGLAVARSAAFDWDAAAHETAAVYERVAGAQG